MLGQTRPQLTGGHQARRWVSALSCSTRSHPSPCLHPFSLHIGPPSLLSPGLLSPPLPIAPAYPTPSSQPSAEFFLQSPFSLPWVNKPSISCPDKEHIAPCKPDSPGTALPALPGSLALSILWALLFLLLRRCHPSALCLTGHSDFLCLSSAWLFIAVLSPLPTTRSPTCCWIWVFCRLLIRVVLQNGAEKRPRAKLISSPQMRLCSLFNI